ncbi:MAG: hypothetical protein U1A26_02680 [Candidatus Sungbacteria bacterium]|nr:hypothetical protein [Candidatus Sungbacteria bacterium]
MLTANLLPEAEQHVIARDHARRIIRLFSVALSVILALGAFLLVPSYFQLLLEERSFADATAREEEAQKKLGVRDTLVAARSAAAVITTARSFFTTTIPVSPLVEYFLRQREGVVINAFSLKKDGSLSMSGVARVRRNLLALEEEFRNSDQFQQIHIPPGDIIQDQDIHFSLEAQLKPHAVF